MDIRNRNQLSIEKNTFLSELIVLCEQLLFNPDQKGFRKGLGYIAETKFYIMKYEPVLQAEFLAEWFHLRMQFDDLLLYNPVQSFEKLPHLIFSYTRSLPNEASLANEYNASILTRKEFSNSLIEALLQIKKDITGREILRHLKVFDLLSKQTFQKAFVLQTENILLFLRLRQKFQSEFITNIKEKEHYIRFIPTALLKSLFSPSPVEKVAMKRNHLDLQTIEDLYSVTNVIGA